MGKSMYSLILSDEVVAAVDKMAYSVGTSRSNMINQILAEYFSFTTPEKTMKDIFDHVIKIIDPDETFKIQLQPSEAMLSIRSPLRFRYNPTIKYMVELYSRPDSIVGELRVVARTQNSTLISTLTDFFNCFGVIEKACCQKLYSNYSPDFEAADGRFTRKLRLSKERSCCDNEEIGSGIVEYIRILDYCLKTYFEDFEAPEKAIREIHKIYYDYLKQGATII